MTLERLKELEQAATPGPWRVVGRGYRLRGFPQVEMPDEKISYFPVDTDANADLIVTLRNNAEALIEVAEAAREVARVLCYDNLERLDAALAKLEVEK